MLEEISDPGRKFKVVSIDACPIGASPPGSDFQLDIYDEYERTARNFPGVIAFAVLVVGLPVGGKLRYLGIAMKRHMEGWAPSRYDWLPLLQKGLQYGPDSLQIRSECGWVCELPGQGGIARQGETKKARDALQLEVLASLGRSRCQSVADPAWLRREARALVTSLRVALSSTIPVPPAG